MQIKNVKVAFLEESIIRSGYPMQIGEPDNLYDEADWSKTKGELLNGLYTDDNTNNLNRANKLANTPSGSGHNNFLKGIIVQFDLQYPEYFSPQLQRYHWIDIVSSQSKMHKITSRELTVDDFTEHVDDLIIKRINDLIYVYNNMKKDSVLNKSDIFNKIISNLPSGYLKWMGISTNYLQLNFRRAQ